MSNNLISWAISGERVVFSIRSPSFSTGMRDYKKEKMDFWMELLFGSLNVTRTILPGTFCTQSVLEQG